MIKMKPKILSISPFLAKQVTDSLTLITLDENTFTTPIISSSQENKIEMENGQMHSVRNKMHTEKGNCGGRIFNTEKLFVGIHYRTDNEFNYFIPFSTHLIGWMQSIMNASH